MKSFLPKIKLSGWDYLMILICSVPAFYLLGISSIYIWDEAVYANAAFDMAKGSSWLVPEQSAYNTKPPLVLWLQAISLNIFPWPEFAVRLPSALSVTGILFMLAAALRRWNFNIWARILVMIAFVGHEGFIRAHIARTGDLDAVMTLFVVGYTLTVLDAIHFKRWSSKYHVFFCLMLIAAFYSKSIAGWMMLGPLGLVWLLSPLRNVLWSFKFLVSALLSIGICVLYYLIRQSIQPGYLDLTWHSEYMRMFKNAMHWHEHPFNYYFKNFVTLKFYTPWIFFLITSILYSLFVVKQKFIKDHLLRWIILALGYMVLISIPAVKLEWYDAPAYPFFSLILGVVACHITWNLHPKWKLLWLIPIAFILFRKINFIRKDTEPRHPFEYEGAILRQTEVDENTKIFMPVETPEHRLQLDFYRKLKLKQTGEDVEVLESAEQLKVGDRVIVRNENMARLEGIVEMDTIKAYEGLGFEIGVISLK